MEEAKVTTAEQIMKRSSLSIVVVDMFVAVDIECEWCNNLTISYEVIYIEADDCTDMNMYYACIQGINRVKNIV